jgi:hypothetical protein
MSAAKDDVSSPTNDSQSPCATRSRKRNASHHNKNVADLALELIMQDTGFSNPLHSHRTHLPLLLQLIKYKAFLANRLQMDFDRVVEYYKDRIQDTTSPPLLSDRNSKHKLSAGSPFSSSNMFTRLGDEKISRKGKRAKDESREEEEVEDHKKSKRDEFDKAWEELRLCELVWKHYFMDAEWPFGYMPARMGQAL